MESAMIKGIGTDIVECQDRQLDCEKERPFGSVAKLEHCGRAPRLAGRFAARGQKH